MSSSGICMKRKVGEKILIGDGIEIEVKRIGGSNVMLRVVCDRSITVLRAELGDEERKKYGKGDFSPVLPGGSSGRVGED